MTVDRLNPEKLYALVTSCDEASIGVILLTQAEIREKAPDLLPWTNETAAALERAGYMPLRVPGLGDVAVWRDLSDPCLATVTTASTPEIKTPAKIMPAKARAVLRGAAKARRAISSSKKT